MIRLHDEQSQIPNYTVFLVNSEDCGICILTGDSSDLHTDTTLHRGIASHLMDVLPCKCVTLGSVQLRQVAI